MGDVGRRGLGFMFKGRAACVQRENPPVWNKKN